MKPTKYCFERGKREKVKGNIIERKICSKYTELLYGILI
jgi:hypothetical protein